MSEIYKESEVTLQSHLHNKIEQHESKLVKVETILERVAANQDKMAESLGAISNSIQKQELLLEKLTNLETNTKASINRIHQRIDERVVVSDNKFKAVDKTLGQLDLALTFSKYPKLAVSALIVLYLTSIKEIMDAIIHMGG